MNSMLYSSDHQCYDLRLKDLSSTMSSSKAAALTEFHFFPRLPAEIRLQIWRLARPEALVLSYFNYFSSSVCQYKMAHGGTLQLRREAARVFGVCREAREEFVISNELKQDSRLQHQQPSFMYCKPYLGVGGVFVDWEVDILHVQCGDGKLLARTTKSQPTNMISRCPYVR